MKFYSFKTANTSLHYFDKKEWQKHVRNLEKKVDSLWNYINLVRPNYSIINWNPYDLPLTDDKFMMIDKDHPAIGAIYKHIIGDSGVDEQDSLYYYFLKCFNNNDLIWGKTNIRFINDFPTIEWLNKIDLNQIGDDEAFQPQDNSWLLIDSNSSLGYKILPSTSGYGGAYTMLWKYNAKTGYYIECKLTENHNQRDIIFFNSPYQVRWNTWGLPTTISADDYYILKNNSDIQTTNREYYQGQKQLMHKVYHMQTSINNIIYEEVFADYTHYEDEIMQQQKITWKIPNNIMGVYYW